MYSRKITDENVQLIVKKLGEGILNIFKKERVCMCVCPDFKITW